MLRLIAVWTLLLTAVGGDSAGDVRRECDDAKTTYDMEQCLTRVVQREDSLLHQAERRVRARLDTALARRFDSATASWERYRDAECRSLYEYYTPGTIAPIEYLECRVVLARDRRANLIARYNLDL